MHMSRRPSIRLLLAAAALATIPTISPWAPAPAFAQASAGITYQGTLKQNDLPVTGIYDIRFELFDARLGGQKIGPTLCVNDVRVTNGLFTTIVPLPALTSGVPVFLEVSTRLDNGEDCSGSEGYVLLTRRQQITPTPIAVAASAITQKSPSVPGALRYNPTAKRFEGFTGVFWVPLTQGAELPPANIVEFTPISTNIHQFTVPAGVTRIGVDPYGAGGGGMIGTPETISCTSTMSGGFGGGSGAAIRAFVDITPGEILTITVGSGGARATAVGQNGGNGGDTVLSRQGVPMLIAGGGGGGKAGILGTPQSGGTPCFTAVLFSTNNGAAGIASVPPPAVGISVISSINGNFGTRPSVAICTNGFINHLGCGGQGAAPVSLGGPIGADSGVGGFGGERPFGTVQFSNPGSGGRAKIWWD
jgi:hypothetical protein